MIRKVHEGQILNEIIVFPHPVSVTPGKNLTISEALLQTQYCGFPRNYKYTFYLECTQKLKPCL